jgi:hypothetical protein
MLKVPDPNIIEQSTGISAWEADIAHGMIARSAIAIMQDINEATRTGAISQPYHVRQATFNLIARLYNAAGQIADTAAEEARWQDLDEVEEAMVADFGARLITATDYSLRVFNRGGHSRQVLMGICFGYKLIAEQAHQDMLQRVA